MSFLAAYAFAFTGCALLALRKPGKAEPCWVAGHGSLAGILAWSALALALLCPFATPLYDAWMSLVAGLCLVMLAAIAMTALRGFRPQLLPVLVPVFAGLGTLAGLLTVFAAS